ncbi:MAG: serine/threonine-protein kinase [Kofleriaceae bacterium]
MSTVSTEPVAPSNGDAGLPVGTEVGEYVVEAVLGRGGFGTVYRASHPVIGKQVAIKVLARKYAADPTVISRFAAEARAVNQIRHRNIIDIFQFSQLADGRHYYVMECLDGEPLDRYLAEHGPLTLAEALPILRAIGRALDAAHAKGIAHRDLKPENIFLARDPDGEQFPKLLDFGIAKLLGGDDGDNRHRTATGMPIGTPYYMSPEQCRGKDVDQRTDIYSFGILAFRVLTGTYPFDGDDYIELLFKQVNEAPPAATTRNPALPASADAAIGWMMAKDPAARPTTLAEALTALAGGALSGSIPPPLVTTARSVAPDPFAQTAVTPPTLAPVPRPTGKRPAVWIGSALVLVCSAAGVMLLLNNGKHPAPDVSSGPATRSEPQPVGGPSEVRLDQDSVVPGLTGPVPVSKIKLTLTLDKAGPAKASARLGDHTIEVPGELEVTSDKSEASLVIEAPGYKAKTMQVTPDHDQQWTIKLERERRPNSVTPPAHREDHDSHSLAVPDFKVKD